MVVQMYGCLEAPIVWVSLTYPLRLSCDCKLECGNREPEIQNLESGNVEFG